MGIAARLGRQSHPQVTWLFGQLGFIAVAILLTYSRRSGPQRAPRRSRGCRRWNMCARSAICTNTPRRPTSPWTSTMSAFVTRGRRRLGLRSSTGNDELSRAVADRWTIDRDDLRTLLDSCESARFFEDLSEREGLDLVQRLHKYFVLLKLVPPQQGRGPLMEAVSPVVSHVRAQMSKVIVGQTQMLDQCVVALLCRGHATAGRRARNRQDAHHQSARRRSALRFQRVQATSDLMPADILGTNVLNMATSTFAFHAGPVFTDLVAGGRRSTACRRALRPRLLECMEEHQVTVDGTRHPLSAVLHRLRHAESHRVRRHLSAAGSAARPLPVEDRRRLSERRGRGAVAQPVSSRASIPAISPRSLCRRSIRRCSRRRGKKSGREFGSRTACSTTWCAWPAPRANLPRSRWARARARRCF